MPAHRWLVVSCFLVVAVAPGSTSRAQQTAETPQQRVERILDDKATAEFLNTQFGDVLKDLAEKHGVPMELSLEASKAGLIQIDESITVNLNKQSLRSILYFLFDQYGLHYTVKPNGTLLIIPATKENLATRIESKPQRVARERLTKVLKEETTCEFDKTPFGDILAFLADQHDCVIGYDRRLVKDRKLLSREPVSFVQRGMPFGQTLKAVLVPLGLQAKIQNEMIFITAREEKESPRPADVDKAYAQEIDLELKERSLAQLASELTTLTKVPVVADFPAFNAAKIKLSMPIDVEAKKVPLRDILKSLPPVVPPLQFVDRDGVILITPVKNNK